MYEATEEEKRVADSWGWGGRASAWQRPAVEEKRAGTRNAGAGDATRRRQAQVGAAAVHSHAMPHNEPRLKS
jgi:hypothetical protein